jgi:hypothetical protein
MPCLLGRPRARAGARAQRDGQGTHLQTQEIAAPLSLEVRRVGGARGQRDLFLDAMPGFVRQQHAPLLGVPGQRAHQHDPTHA